MTSFIPGLELSRRFYQEAVRPVLAQQLPDLRYAAGRIGSGSDVLGFDTEMSTDHDWGPMVELFLPDEEAIRADDLRVMLDRQLPESFAGYPVRFVSAGEGEVLQHGVRLTTVREFFREYLSYDIDQPLEAADWLTFPSQKLRTIRAGAIHHDGPGALTALRARLDYYPRDVWLYLLAAGWGRIGQEEHLMPRAGYVGDELGSGVIGSRLVRDIMRQGFLMEREYAPYAKWFGTAFRQLACAPDLTPSLARAQTAATWQERESALSEAYEALARMHNALGLTERMPEAVSPFHGRPFQVIQGGEFAEAIRARITDPAVQRIAAERLIGSLDQFSDSTDLAWPQWRPVLRQLYT